MSCNEQEKMNFYFSVFIYLENSEIYYAMLISFPSAHGSQFARWECWVLFSFFRCVMPSVFLLSTFFERTGQAAPRILVSLLFYVFLLFYGRSFSHTKILFYMFCQKTVLLLTSTLCFPFYIHNLQHSFANALSLTWASWSSSTDASTGLSRPTLSPFYSTCLLRSFCMDMSWAENHFRFPFSHKTIQIDVNLLLLDCGHL